MALGLRSSEAKSRSSPPRWRPGRCFSPRTGSSTRGWSPSLGSASPPSPATSTPAGLLAFTRWLEVPPRGSLRLFATTVEALERRGVEGSEALGRRLLLVRSWKTATLLVKNGDFTPEELAAAQAIAEACWFDLARAPGMAREEANRFSAW